MPSSDPVIVLAAGRGTRMGGPKALMDVAGEPWWRRQCSALAEVTNTQIWVLSPDVRHSLTDPPAPIDIVEADAHSPMFASLTTGLQHLAADPPSGVFVLPVDVPAATPTVWAALRDHPAPSIPTYNGHGGHPVRLPWSWVIERIDLTTPDPGGRLNLLLGEGAIRVPVDDDSVCQNLNRPEDLERWLTSETRS